MSFKSILLLSFIIILCSILSYIITDCVGKRVENNCEMNCRKICKICEAQDESK